MKKNLVVNPVESSSLLIYRPNQPRINAPIDPLLWTSMFQ